jgi:hypothetical protein
MLISLNFRLQNKRNVPRRSETDSELLISCKFGMAATDQILGASEQYPTLVQLWQLTTAICCAPAHENFTSPLLRRAYSLWRFPY